MTIPGLQSPVWTCPVCIDQFFGGPRCAAHNPTPEERLVRETTFHTPRPDERPREEVRYAF